MKIPVLAKEAGVSEYNIIFKIIHEDLGMKKCLLDEFPESLRQSRNW